MMFNTEEVEHGECCCCLQQGDHRDVNKLYYWDEQPEIYQALFKNTFDIVIKHPENTKLICDVCIVKLREAYNFRSMVDSSQQRLSDRVNWQMAKIINDENNLFCSVKIESLKNEADNMADEVDILDTGEVEKLVLAKGVDINSDNLVWEEAFSQVMNTENIKCEVDDETERRRMMELLLEDELDIKIEDTVWEEAFSQVMNTENIKCEVDDEMERRRVMELLLEDELDIKIEDTDVQEVVIYKTEKQTSEFHCLLEGVLTVEHSVWEEAFIQIMKSIKCTIDQETVRDSVMEILLEDEVDVQSARTDCTVVDNSGAFIQHKLKNASVMLIRDTSVEKLVSHDRCQNKQMSAYVVHTGGENLYCCNFCDYKTPKKIYVNRHLQTHTGERPYSCNVCQYKAGRKDNLTKHMRTHTRIKEYSSDICQYKTKRKYNLKDQLSIHTEEKAYTCDICQYKTIIKSNFTVHLRIHEEKLYFCDVCHYKGRRKGHLKLHMKTHTKAKLYNCNLCLYKTETKAKLISHIYSSHTRDLLICNICQFKSTTTANLKKHLRTHTGELFSSEGSTNLARKTHFSTNHRKKRYICEYCLFQTSSKTNLKLHQNIHTGNKPLSGDLCEYKTASSASLDKHKEKSRNTRNHTGEKPYSCNFCQYKATKDRYLKRHLLTHIGDKPYSCYVCQYKTTREMYLEQHLRTHTEEKLHSCDNLQQKIVEKSVT